MIVTGFFCMYKVLFLVAYSFDSTWHSGFFPQFWFCLDTSNVHFKSRESDISHEPIDDLASKLINHLTKSVKKVPLYVKRCKSISKFDRIAENFYKI